MKIYRPQKMTNEEMKRWFFGRAIPIPECGCFVWEGAVNSSGYGSIKVDGKVISSSRLAWELEHGSIPNGLYVLHTCDNRLCVNPKHLYLGTPKENMIDKQKHGNCTLASISREQVHEIRESKYSYSKLSKIYGIAISTISRIKNRKLWAYI